MCQLSLKQMKRHVYAVKCSFTIMTLAVNIDSQQHQEQPANKYICNPKRRVNVYIQSQHANGDKQTRAADCLHMYTQTWIQVTYSKNSKHNFIHMATIHTSKTLHFMLRSASPAIKKKKTSKLPLYFHSGTTHPSNTAHRVSYYLALWEEEIKKMYCHFGSKKHNEAIKISHCVLGQTQIL